MNIDAILFDLDGTLIEYGHVLLPAPLAAWGHPRSLPEVTEAFRIQFHWFYKYTSRLMAAGREDPHLFQRLYERITLELEIDDPTIPLRMGAFFAADPVPPLYDDVLPLLLHLHKIGLPLGIITQRDRPAAQRFLTEHNLSHCFSVLIAGDDGHGRKPTPEPFYAALEEMSIAPERAIFIGDRIDDDCHGAKAAGLIPFLIDRNNQHAEAPANADFVSLRRLTDLLVYLPTGKATE